MTDINEEMERLVALVQKNIEVHGQHIWSVTVDKDDGPEAFAFAYTVGNYERGYPELLITGPIADRFSRVLDMLSKIQSQRGRGFEHGEEVSLGGKYLVCILDAGAAGRTECAIFVGNFYNTDDYEVRQVLICDPQGRWPWEPECAEGYCAQRIVNKSIN